MAGVFLLTPAITLAQGEHQRRVATELLVIKGDMKRLLSTKAGTSMHKGLLDRIGGGLAGLDVLRRLANEEQGRMTTLYEDLVPALRTAFQKRHTGLFLDITKTLMTAYPFAATGILPAHPLPIRIKRGRSLHEELCAACHDEPVMDVERPAYNLFAEAKRLLPKEFAARMVVGVRGDRLTGIDNPLTDEQIASMIAFYVSGT